MEQVKFCKYGCREQGRLCCFLCEKQVRGKDGQLVTCSMVCTLECPRYDYYMERMMAELD